MLAATLAVVLILTCLVAPSSSLVQPRVQIYKTADDLSNALCENLVQSYQKSVAERGSFLFTIPGGSILSMLANLKGSSAVDWSKCKMAYVNHRAVPQDDETSTHFKALPLFLQSWQEQGLDILTLSGSSDAVLEASLYTQKLAALPQNAAGQPVFDLSLIGVGLDGHVGSIYPDSAAVEATENVVSVVKTSSQSISLSLGVMLASRE
jgi:6-phosphogluconolactonase